MSNAHITTSICMLKMQLGVQMVASYSALTVSIEYIISTKRFDAVLYQN